MRSAPRLIRSPSSASASRSSSVARSAARRAASGSSAARTSEMRARSRTSTPVTNMPRRGKTSTSCSCASCRNASRTGVRPRPSCCISSRSSITAIAAAAGLEPEELDLYGTYKAKVSLSVLERLADKPDAKLVCVTAITPTKFGEGKTTTSVSLTQGLGAIGRKPVLCLREASLGPVFGIKGGAAGAGYAQVVPMEDMNLHFTGDIHAIGAANNLLAAMVEASILHGNPLGLDALSVSWRRCVDINDRALRDIVVGLGGKANGYTRQTGFDITAASEVMAIVAVASDLHDLRERLGAITVGNTRDGEPVTAEQLK